MSRPIVTVLDRIARPWTLKAYLRLVGTGGCAVLLALLAGGGGAFDFSIATGVLVLLLIVGENTPIRVPGHDDEVTTSSAFALALLLLLGPAPAAAAQALGSAIADVRLRKPPRTIMFNVGQYTISLAVAAVVLDVASSHAAHQHGSPFGVHDVVSLALAGAAYYVVNNVLAGTASALSTRQPVVSHLREDLAFQSWSAGLVLAFTPLVVGIAQSEQLLIPFLFAPLMALHRAGAGARTAERQALHDALTGLPNRVLFRHRMRAAIGASEARATSVCVLIMDLDRFKEINDTLGHYHGDLLLQQVARRLQESLPEEETIARFGGDEFAVLLPGLPDTQAGERVAARVLERLREPILVKDLALRVDASIGIAASPEHGTDIDELLKRADVAMYVAKANRAGVQLYAPGDDSNSIERLALASDLRDALDREEFVLHYQPQVDVATGTLVGAEALIRWEHPQRGMVPPGAFITLAENTGVIGALTSQALRMAVKQCASWRAAGLPVPVAVNVSAQDVLGHHLVNEVAGLLAEFGVPASAVKLELTESMLLVDPQRAQEVLDELSAMGVRIAIDDFGTGYSSLAYLARLPIDELKIDRSFINRLHESDSAVIVSSTLELARRLGLRTIAEGVEDATTLDVLAANQCDVVQGYYFSRPLPAESFEQWAIENLASPVGPQLTTA